MENKIISSDFLKRLERLSLNIEKLMNVGGGGARKSRAKGSSVEFSDFREYTAGDDIKRIDWNAYGRLNRLFVKLYMEEREAFINVFLDCSRSMEFDKKSILSTELAAALSYLSLINMDRLCLNFPEGDNLRVSEVFGGRGQFNRAVSFLERAQFINQTDLVTSIKKKRFVGRGLAIIISDFFTPGDMDEVLKYLVFNRQEIMLLHILSPHELNPKVGGSMKLKDAETKEEINVEFSAFTLNKYEKALNSFISDLNEKCKKYGGLYINIKSDEKMEKVLFEDLIESRIIK
jgi:uncharacterized protein (DUF58 family)